MRPLNVLHVSDKLTVGDAAMHGVTRLFAWWIPRFDRSRYNVMGGSLREKDHAGAFLESLGIRMFYMGRGKFDPRTLLDLTSVIRRERIDILHLHGYGATTFGRVAAALRGIPCIVHEHMFDADIPSYQRLADRVLSPLTTTSMAVSESVKRFLVDYRAVPEGKISVVYNGVPLAEFNSGNALTAARWRAEHNVPPDHLVVATVGRLHPIKGHTDFLEAAAIVARQQENVTFAIVGDGDLMDPLRARAEETGIAERVVFLGHREDVPSLLRGVDVKAIASHSEGVPMTLFEAMACGCAIVSTDVGGLGEVIRDGETGLLVPPRDPVRLAERLLKVTSDDELRDRLATAAREDVANYDIEATVRRMERVYDELAR